jgi:hypothetical protein
VRHHDNVLRKGFDSIQELARTTREVLERLATFWAGMHVEHAVPFDARLGRKEGGDRLPLGAPEGAFT